MSDNLTTKTQISDEVNQFYSKKLLERAKCLLLHDKFADVEDIPQNAGTKTIAFRRYTNLPKITTPLTEGVTPAGNKLAQTTLTAALEQYGDYTAVTDVVEYTSQDRALTIAVELQGDQAGESLDAILRDIMNAGTNIQYANARTARNQITASTDKLDATDIDNAVMTLKLAKAKKITAMVNPDTGYNTTPVRPCYVGICHPRVTPILQGFTGWIDVEKYANKADVMEGEVGKYGDVRFIETTEAKVFTGEGASSIDVYSTLILGMHAYAKTRLTGKEMESIIKPLGSGEDPLNQRCTAAWKTFFTGKITNDTFMIRVEAAVS
ncbi:MAG: N4-gp56 family major capsid protein [Patescibacteria group bacterium]|nr:N4-gp56 family major capsid protein [Patescibacteria group bacterium]